MRNMLQLVLNWLSKKRLKKKFFSLISVHFMGTSDASITFNENSRPEYWASGVLQYIWLKLSKCDLF